MEIILVGSGGCMRELAWQMLECGSGLEREKWTITGYVDVDKPVNGYGVSVGGENISYLGDDSYFEKVQESVNVVVSIGTAKKRRAIVEKLKKYPLLRFPNIVIGNAYVCNDAGIYGAEGCIVSMDCRISTNVVMGNFVFMNTGSMVCHDGKIEDFVTIGPDTKLAGFVSVGKNTDIGMGTKVIQGVCIGSDVIVGAGSVVVKNTGDNCTIMGVPAREF